MAGEMRQPPPVTPGAPRAGPQRVPIAGRLALGWSVLVTLVGVALLLALPPAIRSAESGYCENGDHPGPCSSVGEMLVPGVVVLAIGAGCVAASVGLLRGRRWARWAVALSFSAWAVGALAGALAVVRSSQGLHVGALVAWLAAAGFFVTVAGSATARSGTEPPAL